MRYDTQTIDARLARIVRERIEPAIQRRAATVSVEAWHCPDEPVPFTEAVNRPFSPFAVGEAWGGKPWGTSWFHVTGVVPADFGTEDGTSVELRVDLGFHPGAVGFNAEGLAWRPDGSTIKGIEPENNFVPIESCAGEHFELYVEAAANPIVDPNYSFTPTPVGSRRTAGDAPAYRLDALELVERDDVVWSLQQDIWVLRGVVAELPEDSTRAAEIVLALDRAADALDPDDVAGTAAAARVALAPVLATPAPHGGHRAIAVGHAHIDSAWLWPARETVRKCARTFSNVLDLMDRDPEFTFAASSAQQYAWIRDSNPDLWRRIRERVAEGRWIPVGGMWVESDTNLPGGEALVRQFVHGKRFFLDEFGVDTREAWLPDSFGYSAALPQIVKGTGTRWFLTQKPSWNETNKLPHTSFLWQGIDGSRVLTHCPPADRYNSDVSPADLRRGERNNRERGVVDESLLLYGFGDGGGGPTREMLAAAHRQHNLDGSPRVELGTPAQLFEALERDLTSPPVWSGEMYLEFHRGTYTSQIRTKQGNRRSEHLLREAELWSATAAVRLGARYPHDDLDRIWRTVLLQQFHDILPGSSIAWVYEDAEAAYAQVADELEAMIAETTSALAGPGTAEVRFNAAPVPSAGVAALSGSIAEAAVAVRPTRVEAGWLFDTGKITAIIDADGLLASLTETSSGRNAIAPGAKGALYTIFRDTPTQYDAWDIDRTYRRHATELIAADKIEIDDNVLVVTRSFLNSTLTTRYSAEVGASELLIETEVDWHEHQKLLKLGFPIDVKADQASSEIQFGHIDRPTHENTSWDFARFETVAHRWIHVAEPGFGVALANDSTYGHDVTRTTRPDGGTTTLVRESLVRGPQFPDPDADQGRHVFHTTVRIAETVLDAADSGYRLNLPVRTVSGDHAVRPLVTIDAPQVFVESVKLADDRSGDVVVRLYEARGGRATDVAIELGFTAERAWRTDLLERELRADEPGADRWEGGAPVTLTLRPFEIATLRFARKEDA